MDRDPRPMVWVGVAWAVWLILLAAMIVSVAGCDRPKTWGTVVEAYVVPGGVTSGTRYVIVKLPDGRYVRHVSYSAPVGAYIEVEAP